MGIENGGREEENFSDMGNVEGLKSPGPRDFRINSLRKFGFLLYPKCLVVLLMNSSKSMKLLRKRHSGLEAWEENSRS